jgi:hypothetical protein
MPANRGSMREDHDAPDTKVPITYIPRLGKNACTRLSVIIVRLNMGEYNSVFHYGAMAYLSNLKRYVLFYRIATQPWSVDQFIPLKKHKEDSLDMIDRNKRIQHLINQCQDIVPVRLTRKRKNKRKQSGTRRRNQSS